MAWIELHQTLPAHRKIMKLRRILKIKTPQAVGHVAMLWLWSIDNAPDGDLSRVDIEDIAEACEWSRSAATFVSAMKEAGLIDGDMKIHDWDEYTGQLMEKREDRRKKDRERQARYRAKKAAQHAAQKGQETPPAPPPPPDPPEPSEPPQEPPQRPEEAQDAPPSKAMLAAAAVGRPDKATGVDPGLGKVMDFYLNRINATPSATSIEELGAFVEDIQPEVIIKAMEYALDEHKTAWSYIRGTLRAYRSRGIRTLADLQRANDEHERSKQRQEDTRNAKNRRVAPRGGARSPDIDPLKGFHTDD